MTLDHRPFQEADAEMISTFPNSSEELFHMLPDASYPLMSSRLLAAAREGHDPTVGLLNGRTAGFVSFIEVQEKKFCTIGNLVVHPEYRRNGVAAYLVKVMVQTAMQRYAVRFVQSSCFSHNKAAYTLYHKMGFRPADMGQRLGPDGDPVLMIHMHLSIRRWAESQDTN
jgi:ribosomal protein S18 acetylase RimI-like enzyme